MPIAFDWLLIQGVGEIALTKRGIAIYVDRSSQDSVIRAPEGRFGIVPSGDNAWERRQPFQPTETTELEDVRCQYR